MRADGAAVFLPPLPAGQQAVVSLTGRVYLATEHPIPGLDGFGSALHPDVLRRLTGPNGEIGTLDATLVARGLGGGALQPVFAAVAPGNARSLRAFLAEGFVPIGREVIVLG